MFELLLYANITCQDAESLIIRISKNKSELPPKVVAELVETVKESVPDVIGTQTTEGTGDLKLTLVFQVTTNEHAYYHQKANRQSSSTSRRTNCYDYLSWCQV